MLRSGDARPGHVSRKRLDLTRLERNGHGLTFEVDGQREQGTVHSLENGGSGGFSCQ